MNGDSFLSINELTDIGFKSFGENVFISRYARFYSPHKMSLGSNVRIDDFCILSGEISIHSYVHISAHCSLFGSRGISIGNYSGLSPYCVIFSETDDFSGEFMINPLVPDHLRKVKGSRINIEEHCQIGASTTVLPVKIISQGAVVGAQSLVNIDLDPWTIYAGVPVRKIKERKRDLLKLVEHIRE